MGCGGSKEEEQFSNVNAPAASGASKTPAAITKADTDAAIAGAVKDPESKRKFSERKRRRVAVASENSEMLASVRWQSAFDAIRKEEFKLPQHVNKIRDVITNHGIFGGLDAEIIEQMVNAMRVNKKKAGEIIINQGDAGDAFYIIGEGAVSVYLCPAADVDANEPVSTVEGGQAFGELALLYDAPRAATIKAVSDCLLFKLGRMHFRNLVSTAMEKSKVGLETRLAKVPVLQALESDQINHLAEAMEQVSFTDGQYIEKMGDIADSLYVLLSGEVACHRDDGQELRLSEGAIFGESSLSESGQKRQANIVAVGNVRCAKLLASDARDILGPLQAAIDHAFTRKVLSSVELFSSFDTKQMTEVISHMTLKKLKKGEAAVKQGEANKAFYVIRSGTCDIVVDENSVKTLGSGEFFGERSILKGEPANASVVASEDEVVLMCLSGEWVSNGSLTALISEVNKSREAELAAKKKTKLVIKHDDLKKGAVLGEGSFGVVCIASYDGKAYALKALHKGHLISTNQVKNTINEKNIMQQCSHPLILQCYATFNEKMHIKLLLGLALGGELFTRMQKVGTLKTKHCAMYTAMVASALGFLSERHIAHRDLKLENLLLDADGYLKLVDFGFAKVIEPRSWTFCGTPDYLAPEILAHKGHNYAVDWWALGVLTYEMLHGEPPFMEDDQMRTFARITANDYRIQSGTDKAAVDLIKKLLQTNPSKRLGMLQNGALDVTNHEMCRSIDMAALVKKELTPPHKPKLKNETDTSNFDDFGPVSSGKKYNKYVDAKYEPTWEQEFGVMGE